MVLVLHGRVNCNGFPYASLVLDAYTQLPFVAGLRAHRLPGDRMSTDDQDSGLIPADRDDP